MINFADMKYVWLCIFLLTAPVVSGAIVPDDAKSLRCEVLVSTQGKDGKLMLENQTSTSCRVVVYSITGQAIRSLELRPGVVTVVLPKGFYIVKSEYGSQKIVVR